MTKVKLMRVDDGEEKFWQEMWDTQDRIDMEKEMDDYERIHGRDYQIDKLDEESDEQED